MNPFKDIRDLHDHYGFERNEKPGLLSRRLMNFRINFLQEEMDELIDAYVDEDLAEQVDALIDLIVVAIGTLDLMNVHTEAHWTEVLECNMTKVRATPDNPSKRGSTDMDLVKPEGWRPPNHEVFLK